MCVKFTHIYFIWTSNKQLIYAMNKYYNLLKRVRKLEKLIYNKRPKFEGLSCYAQEGEVINADGEDEITSILEDKIKNQLSISDSALEDIFAAIDDDSHTENLQTVVNKIIKSGKGEIPRKTIYRGCSVAEYNNILNNGSSKISQCLSFSESKEVASTFGKRLIAANFEFPIFPYYKLYTYYFMSLKKSLTEEEWKDFDDMSDAQYGINLALNELEWIAPENTVFTLNDDGTFTATLGDSTSDDSDTNDTEYVKQHLYDLCDDLKIDDCTDGYYHGEDSFNIYFRPRDYENTLVSRDALSSITAQNADMHYTYDSNTLEIFVPGLGIAHKEVDVLSLNKDSFSKLVKDMIDDMM